MSWDETDLINKAEINIYTELITIDEKLGTKMTEQLLRCVCSGFDLGRHSWCRTRSISGNRLFSEFGWSPIGPQFSITQRIVVATKLHFVLF